MLQMNNGEFVVSISGNYRVYVSVEMIDRDQMSDGTPVYTLKIKGLLASSNDEIEAFGTFLVHSGEVRMDQVLEGFCRDHLEDLFTNPQGPHHITEIVCMHFPVRAYEEFEYDVMCLLES